jgi:hypothetical protein
MRTRFSRHLGRRLSIVILAALFLLQTPASYVFADDSQKQPDLSEKQLVIKGLYIGMDGNEAKLKMEQILGTDWTVTKIGQTKKILADFNNGDPEVFGVQEAQDKPNQFASFSSPTSKPRVFKCPGDNGFAIINKYGYYCGYISLNENKKVSRISLGGKITDTIFSAQSIELDEFYEQFRSFYNLPDMPAIWGGWKYLSPNGYIITIRRGKFIDIQGIDNPTKLDETSEKNHDTPEKKEDIKFN